jgi:hypothetical protein
LSTLYEAPSKQLISVLGAACLRYRTYTNVPESFWALQWVWLHPYARHKRLFTAAWPIWLETYGAVELEPPVSPTVTFIVRQTPTRTLTTTEGDPVTLYVPKQETDACPLSLVPAGLAESAAEGEGDQRCLARP